MYGCSPMRNDGRLLDQLRPISFERNYTRFAAGSVLARFGETAVLCTCSIEETVPPFLKGTNKGWLTAEYSLLPGSTPGGRARRETQKPSGRTQEIQRLMGRSLRMAVNLDALGPRTLTIDADVLQADGGTRTCAITGSYLALVDALATLHSQGVILTSSPVAAVSVGIVGGEVMLDLCYEEDSRAAVDMNVVLAANGDIIEIQATGERQPFSRQQLNQLTDLATTGIQELFVKQQQALGLV